jgi:RsmE family RNA methyltransferase
MNLILLQRNDFIGQSQVKLSDHRFEHIKTIHRARVADQLTVGLLNGDMGAGTILEMDAESLIMEVTFSHPPPEPLPLTLILGLPRPKMLKRILQACASMGVKNIILMNSHRVEKSYWQSPLLEPDAIKKQLILGLEQAKDTLLPEVRLAKRFKPFVEDELPFIAKGTTLITAHPKGAHPCPHQVNQKITLVIGPEGGFIPYEIAALEALGSQTVHLGQRILKVETAIPAILSKLFF